MNQSETLPITDDEAFSYVIEPDFVRFTMGEMVDARVVGEASERLANDPAYRNRMNLLIDDRRNKVPSRPAEARKAAQLLARYPGLFGPRIAILVNSTVQYGMIRIFGALVQQQGIVARPFRDEADAVAWLRDAEAEPTQ